MKATSLTFAKAPSRRRSTMKRAGVCLLVAGSAAAGGCRDRANGNAHLRLDPSLRFAGYTKTCGDIPRNAGGIPGEIPRDYLAKYTGAAGGTTSHSRGYPTGAGYDAKKIVDGLCTWYLWQGGDPATFNGQPDTGGNPHFWRALEKKTADIRDATGQPVVVTLLKFIDSRLRDERFRTLGLINDPGCVKATAADQFGLYLDTCHDPYSSGIIGIRLSPNPKFDPRRWNAGQFFADPRKFEPPYLAGLTCGVCHVAFNPLIPPPDPEHPRWENLAGAIGNQYLLEGKIYEGSLTKNDFLWHVYKRQPPGTSETSRLSVDWIDNPSAINSIYLINTARPRHAETMNDGTIALVPHILKDGADSMGAADAALRVYVNIGTCGATRMSREDVLLGFGRDQSPFSIAGAEAHCQDYQQTKARIANAAEFLDSQHGFPLAQIDDGRYITRDPGQLALGRRTFAENCARCHSSKVPEGLDEVTKHDPANKPRWVALVERSDFLDKNFLSDDRRYPIVDSDWRFAIGTNLKRAMATNAVAGHIWQDFSSKTYKELPSPGTVALYNPFDPAHPTTFTIPSGHGYYRVPSLIAVWATAPLLHNNSLGMQTSDPSVGGRLRAFEDAMNKMFHPSQREGVRSIRRTSDPSVLKMGALQLRIPAGAPIDLIANINLRNLMQEHRKPILQGISAILAHPLKSARIAEALKTGKSNPESIELASQMLAINGAPDFIEDHGHEFGSRLAPAQQRALIEYMKTF
jgi:hypothetical protein